MVDMFQKRKSDILKKQDKSSVGNWDKKIKKLCEKINKKQDYYTTSSCAGRVVIMIDQDKKEKGLFIKVYHDLISLKELKDCLNLIKNKKLIKFKQEPCILHVACKDFDDAKKLLNKGRLAGWKKSGILSSSRRFIVEMNSTERLEFPIVDKGKILGGDDFLKIVVKKANENLKKSWKKIEKLRKSL